MTMPTSLVTGRQYKIVQNSSGHGFQTGEVVTAPSPFPPGTAFSAMFCTSFRSVSRPTYAYNCYMQDLADMWTNRKEHAKYEEEELKDLKKRMAEKEHLIRRLKEFDSDEEEIASVLISAVDGSELPAKERIANLAKLLKGRLKTDLI